MAIQEIQGGEQSLGVFPAGGTIVDVGQEAGVTDPNVLAPAERFDVLIQDLEGALTAGVTIVRAEQLLER